MDQMDSTPAAGGATRRKFIKQSATAAAAVAATGIVKSSLYGQNVAPSANVKGANDRVVVGYIGVGGQGMAHVNSMKGHAGESNLAQAAVIGPGFRRIVRASEDQRQNAGKEKEKIKRHFDRGLNPGRPQPIDHVAPDVAINCEPHCFADVEPGKTVTLKAIADEGAIFLGWSGDCSSSSTLDCTLTMDGPKTATAAFRGRTFGLRAERVGSGRIVSEPPDIDCGEFWTMRSVVARS